MFAYMASALPTNAETAQANNEKIAEAAKADGTVETKQSTNERIVEAVKADGTTMTGKESLRNFYARTSQVRTS